LRRLRIAACLCVVLACSGPHQSDVPTELSAGQQGQPKAPGRAAQPAEPLKPMTIGGEVSAPKPKSVLDVKWPTNSTQCYQLGVAIFEGVIDRNGNAQEVRLIKGPDNEFTQAAHEAIAQQKFEPAIYRGKPVDVTYHVSINHVPVKKVKGPC
jgi:hypothetical protein